MVCAADFLALAGGAWTGFALADWLGVFFVDIIYLVSKMRGFLAQVAELVDALGSGPSACKGVEVRVLSWAQIEKTRTAARFFYLCRAQRCFSSGQNREAGSRKFLARNYA